MSNQQGMYYPQDQEPREQEGQQRGANTDPREQNGAQQQQQWQEPTAEAYSGYERGYADYEQGYNGPRAGYEQEKVRPQAQQTVGRTKLTTQQIIVIVIAIVILANVFSWIHIGTIISFLVSVALLALVAYMLIFRQGIPSVAIPARSFTIQEHGRLIVKNPAGSINVVRGTGRAVEVTGRQSTGGIFGSPWNTRVEASQQGDTIEVSTRQTSWQPSKIELTITVPTGCDVQIEGNAGTIDIDGIDGEAVVETNAGTINVQHAVLRGNSRFKTNAGTIEFSGTLDPQGRYRMESNLGTITVALNNGTAFELDAKTDLGSVTNRFGSNIVGSGPHPKLELRTNLGTIDVH